MMMAASIFDAFDRADYEEVCSSDGQEQAKTSES